jgi:hypothetical protein
MLTSDEIVETPVTSIHVQVAYIDLEADHMRNKLVHIESIVRYAHKLWDFDEEIEIILFLIKLSC